MVHIFFKALIYFNSFVFVIAVLGDITFCMRFNVECVSCRPQPEAPSTGEKLLHSFVLQAGEQMGAFARVVYCMRLQRRSFGRYRFCLLHAWDNGMLRQPLTGLGGRDSSATLCLCADLKGSLDLRSTFQRSAQAHNHVCILQNLTRDRNTIKMCL